MNHPIHSARLAIQKLLTEALKSQSVDVLNWYSKEYASSTAVVIADVRGSVSRDRFAASKRLPFIEETDIDIVIFPTGTEYNWDEESDKILEVLDVCISTFAGNYTLGGDVTGVVRCQVESYTIGPEEGHLVGRITVLLQLRINRRTE